MSKSSNVAPVKILTAMIVFASALYLAWAGFEFGKWLKHLVNE